MNTPPPEDDQAKTAPVEESNSHSRISIQVENIMPQIERTFLQINSIIGKYKILSEIDRGGMAVVYKACQLDLDRDVALKVLPANITINRSFVDRFLAEAHSVAHLTHPNIVNIHEVGMEDNIYFLAMDYIAGKNLYYYLHAEKPKLIDVLEIVARLADALSYAHGQKILHRDLKLNNVIMKDRLTPVLIDFGLAKALESTDGVGITQPGEIMGSPAYMAPERLLGEGNDSRSDICSLGIMLYEMVTFKNPYLDPRSIHQTTINVLESDPIRPRKIVPWLPVEIEAITLKAMHPDREKRYQTMDEFKDDIRRYQRGDPVVARPPSFFGRCFFLVRKHWSWVVIGLLVALFSSLFGVSVYLQNQKELPSWRLVYEERFESDSLPPDYEIVKANGKTKNIWKVDSHALYYSGSPMSSLKLDRPFTRDIRVEFDISVSEKNFYGAGFFIGGTSAENGYRFYINQNGTPACGIEYPHGTFLYTDIKDTDIPSALQYHVVIEKRDHQLTFFINNILVATIADLMAPLGKDHQNIGFFGNGSAARFDNLKVFRLAIPQVPSPTLVADRFYEHGDFETAFEEYKALLVDLPNTDFVTIIRLRMADCQLRRNRLSEANAILSSIPISSQNRFNTVAIGYFFKGVLSADSNIVNASRDAFARLSICAPASIQNRAAFDFQFNRTAAIFSRGELDSAHENLLYLNAHYPAYAKKTGKLFIDVARSFAKSDGNERAVLMLRQVDSINTTNAYVVALARKEIAQVYLSLQEKSLAIDALNRAVALSERSEAVWQSWLILATIYEYDQSVSDALTIYRTMARDCPGNLPERYLAQLHIIELAALGFCNDDRNELLATIVDGPHPFPLPRIIGQLYRGDITDKHFIERYKALALDNPNYLWYLAYKAISLGNHKLAREYLYELLDKIPPQSWLYTRTDRLIKDLSKRRL